jgi:photosystem II stability/assembly factor-like uncharacterized protein
MDDVALVIGTRKGLFSARSQGGDWEVDPIRFASSPVTAAAFDPASGRILAAVNTMFWGVSLVASDDHGRTWSEPSKDAENAPVAFPESTDASLKDIWQLRFSPTEPGVVYAGVEPAALFRSEDGGHTFTLVQGLWDHPHRPTWQPGGGGLCLHTVLPHATDPRTLTVAISTGGVYRSADGGASWEPRNKGIRADFMGENPFPEYGQCVHKVDLNPSEPDRYYLQHHGGVYRSDDDTASWTRIDDGLPADFGFPIAASPVRPGGVYVIPLIAAEDRSPAGHHYQVCRSDDAGATWTAHAKGLPDEPCHASVLRDAFCTDGSTGLYFGTRDGFVYASRDEGESWTEVARHLPDVLCVRASTL